MQILANNLIGREKIIFLTNSYLNRGWMKKNFTGKFDLGTLLERETNVGKISKKIEQVKISYLDLTGEILVRDMESKYVGIDQVLNFINFYIGNEMSYSEAVVKCLEEGIIDSTDVQNLETYYDVTNINLN